MNEKIKEIIIKSNIDIRGHYDESGNTPAQLQKFAELIVKECAKFLDENSGYDDANNAWHPEPEELLKHFGVEE